MADTSSLIGKTVLIEVEIANGKTPRKPAGMPSWRKEYGRLKLD